MLTNDRNAYRNVFFIAWQKHQKKLPLVLEETHVIEVILDHPEFHALLDDPGTHLKQEYMLEENPFLHLSLHLTLRDQIRTNRPAGITDVYHNLLDKHVIPLDVEHLMMYCLMSMLKAGQETGNMPGDQEYLIALESL